MSAIEDKSPNQRSQNWTRRRSQGVQCLGFAPIFAQKHVANRRSAEGRSRGATCSGEEAENRQGRDIRGQRAADIQNREQRKADQVHDSAPVKLGQGRQKHRAKTQAEDVHPYMQIGGVYTRQIKVLSNLQASDGQDGRCHGRQRGLGADEADIDPFALAGPMQRILLRTIPCL